MFKRIHCENCSYAYDELDKCCPKCGKDNPFVQHKRFGDNALIVPFWMQIVLFFVGWLGFQILAIILTLITKNISMEEAQREAFLTFTAYGLLGLILAATQISQFKKYGKQAKNWLAPILGLAGFGAIMLFNMSYNIFLQLTRLVVSDNANETAINSITVTYPLLSVLIIGIIGPMCEEFTYRVGLFGFFRRINKYLAYAITIVVFALIHFDFGSFAVGGQTLVNELLNLPFYMAAAFVFTFLFEKVGFFGSLAAHVTNNLFSVLFSFIGTEIVVKLL